MKEIEAKFNIENVEEVRKRLKKPRAQITEKRHFEDNVVLDTPDDKLRGKQHLLRLGKTDSKSALTYKTGMEFKKTTKRRLTIKAEAAEKVFEQLGYKAKRGYQKYREIWKFGSVEIMIDELPFGNFVEIECPERAINSAAEELGFEEKDRITAADNKTYEVMWQKYASFEK